MVQLDTQVGALFNVHVSVATFVAQLDVQAILAWLVAAIVSRIVIVIVKLANIHTVDLLAQPDIQVTQVLLEDAIAIVMIAV